MKKIFLINTVIAGLIFVSCSQYNLDNPDTSVQGKKVASTTTIEYLETNYMTTPTTSAGYYTADLIPSEKDAGKLVFNGIVTSNDLLGNQYKYIVVQEDSALTPKPRAIRVSVDVNNVTNIYPIGQHVSVIVNGWHIGMYGNTPQLGMYYERPRDGRISPTGIPLPIMLKTVIAYDEPAPKKVVADTMTIAELNSYGGARHMEMDWKLIAIKNAYFTGRGASYGSPVNLADADKIFAPSTNGVGFPQSREIQDGTGSVSAGTGYTFVATSEYSRFAKYPLPASTYVGTITCIASWFQGRPTDKGVFQLTLRTLNDLGAGYEGYLQSVGVLPTN
ncbi:MAG: DUF5689 domain-containing protein [Paludibacter sp.]|nr:DUF5689 domain-containing protein [Paludibacter sp.]